MQLGEIFQRFPQFCRLVAVFDYWLLESFSGPFKIALKILIPIMSHFYPSIFFICGFLPFCKMLEPNRSIAFGQAVLFIT